MEYHTGIKSIVIKSIFKMKSVQSSKRKEVGYLQFDYSYVNCIKC